MYTHIMCCTRRHKSMPYVKSCGVSQVFSLRGGGQCFVGSCSLGFMFCLSTDPEHCGIGRCRLLCGFRVFESQNAQQFIQNNVELWFLFTGSLVSLVQVKKASDGEPNLEQSPHKVVLATRHQPCYFRSRKLQNFDRPRCCRREPKLSFGS